jgi:hypothetical protein
MQKLTTGQLILIIVLIILATPWIFTLPVFWNRFNYSSTGQIGDTIGGLTSPFINGLAAILVFITFREQVKANRLLQDQGESQDIMNQIKSLEKNNIQIEITVAEIIRLADMFTAPNHDRSLAFQLNKALYFLSEFELAKSLLEQYHGDKNFLYKKLNYLYKIRFAVHIDARARLEGNLHEAAVAEILFTIQDLNRYFENVNRYQN